MSRRITVPEEATGVRVDVALAQASGVSRSQVQKLLREGLVEVGGAPIDAKYVVRGGEVVVINETPKEAEPPAPKLPILYEDDEVVVVDKPAGLIVHTSETGKVEPTVAAFARARGVQDDDVERPGIVHRLDKDTSGALVIAKTAAAKQELQRQFRQRLVKKTYIALVKGRLEPPQAIITLPIGRHRQRPVQRAVVSGGRAARTSYRVTAHYPGASLVEVELHTGRTHQIRVHFSHLGHPVLGDALYGGTTPGLRRQFLHAASLAFTTPSGKLVEVTSPLPPDLANYLKQLETGQ